MVLEEGDGASLLREMDIDPEVVRDLEPVDSKESPPYKPGCVWLDIYWLIPGTSEVEMVGIIAGWVSYPLPYSLNESE